MRIITGKRKGLKLSSLPGLETRPTESRIKESIFNILGDVSDSTVLDLFSGSGSIGLEFLSRGSKEVYLVDNNKNATKIIKKNVEKMNLPGAYIISSSYLEALQNIKNEKVIFDYIYIDPPYDNVSIYENVLEFISKHGIFSESLLIVEANKSHKINSLVLFNIVDQRQYRDTNIYFLRRK